MKCAVLLPVFSLPNQSKAFRKDTVFFLLPPFSTGCAKISRAGKRTKSGPRVVLVNSHDKSSAYQLHCGLFRLVCTNGMVVSDGTFQRISIVQHFESLDSSSDRNMGTRRICPSHDAAAGEGEDVKRRRWRHIVGAAKGDAFLGRFNAGAMDSVQHANHPGLLSQTPLTRA